MAVGRSCSLSVLAVLFVSQTSLATDLVFDVRGTRTILFEVKCEVVQTPGRSVVVQFRGQPKLQTPLKGTAAVCTVRKLGAGAGISARLIRDGTTVAVLDLPRHYQKGNLRTAGPWGKAKVFRNFPAIIGFPQSGRRQTPLRTVPPLSGGEQLLPKLRK